MPSSLLVNWTRFAEGAMCDTQNRRHIFFLLTTAQLIKPTALKSWPLDMVKKEKELDLDKYK